MKTEKIKKLLEDLVSEREKRAADAERKIASHMNENKYWRAEAERNDKRLAEPEKTLAVLHFVREMKYNRELDRLSRIVVDQQALIERWLGK